MLELLAFVLAGVALVVAVELIAERSGLPTELDHEEHAATHEPA